MPLEAGNDENEKKIPMELYIIYINKSKSKTRYHD